MRKIYDEYLYVPEQGEGVVREKVFFSRLVLSIACMVVCMIAMGYNAYAFFTANVESTANTLQAATYDFVDPSETDEKIIEIIGEQGSVAAQPGKWKYTFEKGNYKIRLIRKEGSSTTGYGKINFLEGENTVVNSFYTQQIGRVDENTVVDERIVFIQVDKTVTIQVVACWGTYSGSDALDETTKKIEVSTDAAARVVGLKTPTSETSANVAAPAALTNNEETTQQGVAPTNPTAVTETPVTGTEEKKDEITSQQQGELQQQEESQKTDSDSVEGDPSTTQ